MSILFIPKDENINEFTESSLEYCLLFSIIYHVKSKFKGATTIMKKLTLLTLLTCTFLLGACSSGKQTTTTTSTKAETTTSSKKVDLNALDLPQLETNVKELE